MQWMAWQLGLAAAAAAVPLLLLLYFLKLKRRELLVASTLLWRRAVQDLQVNAPFQRLRRNLLLLLQMLILLAILAALARPVLSMRPGRGRRHVILIDRSASMNAVEAGRSRLAEAKSRAKLLVESLRTSTGFALRDVSDRAMVIAFDERAKVACSFTSDKAALRAAIERIDPTDGVSRLGQALTVARAFAQSPGEEANNRSAETPAQLELYSDGRIDDLADLVVQAGELRYHSVGQQRNNVAVVTLQARRRFENPSEVDVFATLANYGDEPVRCDVQLSLDGRIVGVRKPLIPARRAGEAGEPGGPGKLGVSYRFVHAGGGVVEVRHFHKDPLADDDAGYAILDPPRSLHVLLVTEGSHYLHLALESCPLARLDVCSPADFDRRAADGVLPYDVVVLDDTAPKVLPRGRYLILGRTPQDVAPCRKLEGGRVFVDWQSLHPVCQHVNLENVQVAESYEMKLPRTAKVIAEFANQPAIAVCRQKGSAFLCVGFDVMESNWPYEPSFVIFLYNATRFLAYDVERTRQSHLRVGQALAHRGRPADAEARVTDPAGRDETIRPDASGMFRYPRTDRAGVYRLAIGDRRPVHFAVNLLDEKESAIEPLERIVLSGEAVQARRKGEGRANVELWPLLALLALALACVEWIVYNSKVRL